MDLGYNYRMTDIQAALGVSQLSKIDQFIKKRRRIWQKYNQAFGKIHELTLPTEQNGCFCAWHIYTVRLKAKAKKSRRQVFDFLRKAGIGVQVHYIPIHMLDLYRKRFRLKAISFPVAEQYYKETMSLPLFAKMTDKEVNFVIKTLKDAIR